MASATTHNNLFKSGYQAIYTGVHKGFSFGAQVSKKLETIKMVDKLGLSILKAASYVPVLVEAVPLSSIETPLKDVKLVTDFFMGFRSLEAGMAGTFAKTWKTLALNVAGLALMFFTIISALSRLKVDVNFITEMAKKVPVFGVLPFAGLMNLSLLTMFGPLLNGSRKNSRAGEF